MIICLPWRVTYSLGQEIPYSETPLSTCSVRLTSSQVYSLRCIPLLSSQHYVKVYKLSNWFDSSFTWKKSNIYTNTLQAQGMRL